MDAEKKMTISLIKSIIVSVKGGLPFHKLEGDYREQNGQRIPFSKYGFKSLDEFLRSIPEVHLSHVGGTTMLTVADPKMDHITSLLNRQKAPKKRVRLMKRPSFGSRQPYRGGAASRSTGFASRPTVNTSRRQTGFSDNSRRPPPIQDNYRRSMPSQDSYCQPMPSQNNYHRPPLIKDVPLAYRPSHHEMGHGDGPRLGQQQNNIPSRRPIVTVLEPNIKKESSRVETELKAYSNTHSIRQGKGFVEYVPLPDDSPPMPVISTKTKTEDGSIANGINMKSPLREMHINSLDNDRLQEKAKPVIPGDVDRKSDNSPVQTIATGRGRGFRRRLAGSVDDVVTQFSRVSVSQNGVTPRNGVTPSQQRVPPSPILHNVPTSPQQHRFNGIATCNGQFLHELEVDDNGDCEFGSTRTVDFKRNGSKSELIMSITFENDCANVAFNDDADSLKNDEDIEDDTTYVSSTYQRLVFRPKFFNYQLIGDDFLLHFANYIDEPCLEIDGKLAECGLCMSGMTLDMCKEHVQEMERLQNLSDRVLLLVGAVDILQGMGQALLIMKMNSILDELTNKRSVCICTIPPLDHLDSGSEHIRQRYNKCIRSLPTAVIKVIDLDAKPFVDSDNKISTEHFNEFGTETVADPDSTPVHLKMWNKQGLREMRVLLQKNLEIKR